MSLSPPVKRIEFGLQDASKFFAEYYDKPRLYMDGQEIGNTISDKNL